MVKAGQHRMPFCFIFTAEFGLSFATCLCAVVATAAQFMEVCNYTSL